MSTHVLGFQSFFSFLTHQFLLTKLAACTQRFNLQGSKMSVSEPSHGDTLYDFKMECKFFSFRALRVGICATLNLCIQALKLYIYHYVDIYLKDVILELSWGA